MQVVNWRVIAHPINWVTILLMLIIAGIGGHFLLNLLGHDPSTSSSQYTTKQSS